MKSSVLANLRLLTALVAVIALAAPAGAQDGDDSRTLHISVGGEYTGRISNSSRLFGDLVYEQIEYEGQLNTDLDKIAATGGLSHNFGLRTRGEAGLGLYNIHRSELKDTFGIDLWQAATFDWPEWRSSRRRFFFSHRFRLDERWSKTGEWDFAVRARYRLTFTLPINGYTVEPGVLYLPLKGEYYVPLGDDVEAFYAKLASFSAGLGYVFNRTWSMDLKYAWLQLRNTIDDDLDTTDHYLEFRIKTSFLVHDLLKSR